MEVIEVKKFIVGLLAGVLLTATSLALAGTRSAASRKSSAGSTAFASPPRNYRRTSPM